MSSSKSGSDHRKKIFDAFVALLRDLFFTFPMLLLLTLTIYRSFPVWTSLLAKMKKPIELYS